MPQFAVFTREIPRTTVCEQALELENHTSAKLRGRDRKPFERVFGPPKVYLVQADTADAAMACVKIMAAERGIDLIVHRAVEVAETLSTTTPKIACAHPQGRG